MKKTIVLFFLFFFSFMSVKSQNNISAVVELNYNTFSHSNLSDFQQELSSDISEVNLRVDDDFGANVGYTIGIKAEELNTLFFASYNSTGGKLSYSDYSGIIRLKQLLKAYTIGGEYQLKLSKDGKKDTFYLGGRGLINFSKLNLDSFSKIYDTVSEDSIDFNSIDLGIGIRLIYDIPISVVKLRLNAGYDLILAGDLKFSEDNDYFLEDDDGDAVKTGWSGFRTGIGIIVPF